MATALNEDRWLERLTDEDQREAAVAELRELILRGLSRSLNHRYGSTFNAEDVVQEAMIKILNSLNQFQGRSRFTTWAMTVATRVGISSLRRKHFQDVSLDSMSGDDSLKIELAVEESEPPADKLDRRAILQKLQELIDSVLTDKQKIAVRAQLEGMPVEEIASRTQSNRNAVYKLVHDARSRLRAGLEQAGILADDVNAIFT